VIVFLAVYGVMALRVARPSFEPELLRQALGFGLPLVPHMLGGVLLFLADRLILERLASLSDVGLYSLGYTVGTAVGLFVGAINSAWTPIFYDTVDTQTDAPQVLGRILTLYVAGVATLALTVGLFARELLIFLVAPQFQAAHVVVPAVATGYVFQGLYFMAVTPLFQAKRTRVIPVITIVAVLVNIALLILWIPSHGILGAAYATIVAFAVQFALTAWFAQRLFPLKYDWQKLATIGLLYTAALSTHYFLPDMSLAISLTMNGVTLALFVAALLATQVVPWPSRERIQLLLGSRQ
jgi:O-antigen/teichoic acid export membrane protein